MLPTHRPLTRSDVCPDPVHNTDAQAKEAARTTLSNPYLMRSVPAGWAVTALQLGEQALMAARTYRLLQLTDHVVSGMRPGADILKLMSLGVVAPTLLRAAQAPLTTLWTAAVRDRYDAAFVVHDFNTPRMWPMSRGDNNVRASRSVVYAGNLRWHADNQVKSALALQRVVLAAGTNLVLFASSMGVALGVSQCVALALVLAYGQRAFGAASAESLAQIDTQNTERAHLGRFWDNVVLGNVNNQARWQERYEQLSCATDARTDAAAQKNARRDLTLIALAAVPMLIGLALTLRAAAQDTSPDAGRKLAQVVVQSPALLAATRNIVGVSQTYFNVAKKRQAELARTLNRSLERPGLNLETLSNPDAISVHHGDAQTTLAAAWPDLLQHALDGGAGRYTLTGDNGAGKSIALLRLKEALGPDSALLLPAELRDLDFAVATGSTGERDKTAVLRALDSGARVLLLDEWDAHLDAANRDELGAALNRASASRHLGGEGRMVIEVSHRGQG